MARLYIRLWLVVIAAMLLLGPANAQLDIRWVRASAGAVLYIDLSSDGNWMALGKWNTTLVYRLPDRQLVQVLHGAPAIFVGNRLLAVGTKQGTELRDVPSFRVVWRMDGGSPVQASRDGKWLLTRKPGFVSGEMLLWQIGPPRLRLSLPEGLRQSAALSADGRLLFVLGMNGIVEVRSTATGRILRRFTVPGFTVPAERYLVASPTGDRLAVVNPSRIVVCRGDNGQVLHSFSVSPAYGPTTVRFSPDGNYLAAGYGFLYENGWWRLWRLSDGAQVAGETFSLTSADEVWTLNFSHDSATLYIVFPFRIRIVHTATGTTVEDWKQATTSGVLGFVANDTQLAIASGEGVHLYAPADGSLIREFTLPHLPYVNAISSDGHVYATYSYDNGIAAFRLNADGSVTHLVTVPLWPATAIDEPLYGGMRLSDDGTRLFIHEAAGNLHLVNVADGSVTTLAGNVSGYDITPDGSLVATIEDVVNLRRVPDGTIVYSLPPAQSLAFVQGGEILALVTKETTFGENLYYRITRYHTQTGSQERGSVTLPRGDAYAEYSVKVSPDGKVFVFYMRGQPMRIFTWHSPSEFPQLTAMWWGDLERGGAAFSRNSEHLLVSLEGTVGVAKGFSDKRAYQTAVEIPSWIGEMPEHLRYAVRSAQTGELLHEGPAYLLMMTGANRARMLMPMPASYSPSDLLLTVQGKPFLKHTVPAYSVSIVLTAGDIDGDNEVTLFDFGRMVASFGSLAGEPEYDIDADLDGDGEVSLWDFSWLVNNFGAIGDE